MSAEILTAKAVQKAGATSSRYHPALLSECLPFEEEASGFLP